MASPVSVLLPCYNAAELLLPTLKSLSAQTHPEFEIVAVDDGSSDDTLNILNTYAIQDSRLKPFSIPHGGIIEALNFGIRKCEYEFIARMDADDLVAPERLTLQEDYLNSHPEVDLVSSLVEGYPPEEIREGFNIYINWLNSLVTHEEISREIYVESPVAHPSVMVRKTLLEELGGYQEHGWPEDYDLWLRMHQRGCKFAKIEETLLFWRDREERLTRVDSRYSLENFIRAKVHYLCQCLLRQYDSVIIWGAGMMGKRISKYLISNKIPLKCFVDVDKKKIGRTRRGLPIISPKNLVSKLNEFSKPIVLVAVGARGARELIRQRLDGFGLVEGKDWLGVA
ncbi:MAG: glycosyltransferase [Anaerolineales bacterium]|nr:glycosyltransferase [Anaerolineales bacterium]